jgi:hypothetical protein
MYFSLRKYIHLKIPCDKYEIDICNKWSYIFSSENEPDDNKDKLDYAAPDG